MKKGIISFGAYLPYNYLSRATLGKVWGDKGGKGEKSIADVDEDSLTMAVEASMGCFRFIKREHVNSLYFASTTGPYAEKSHSALISVACDLSNSDMFAVDFMSSTKAGTNAIKAALDSAVANPGNSILVVASDMRNGYPKSKQESGFGDGAAAVVIGSGDNLLAEIDYFTSVSEEINDYWRNTDEKYTLHAEERFCDEEGYLREVKIILTKLLKETNTKITDYNKVVLVSQNSRLQVKISKKFGIKPEQLSDTLLSNVGDTGAAQGILGIVNALENSAAGDKILVVDYGNGANAMVLTVTEKIAQIKGEEQIKNYLNTREELDSYVRFLSWRDIAAAEPGGAFKLSPSTAQTWREQNINLRLHGSFCNNCGATSYPISRVCDNCGALDNYEAVRLSDQVCKLYTFSVDMYAGRSDAPVIIQAVAEAPNQAHIYTVLTNCKSDDVKFDMDLELTFRKMHELGNFPNYFWKFRPLRRKRV
ncbi:MAG: hypothetical protein Q8S24_03340 [Eubacteriales bacterium]|nr:hypothetical protein [Eubacteriales bacterium]